MKNRSPHPDELPLFGADDLSRPATDGQASPAKGRRARGGASSAAAAKKPPSRSPQPLLAGLSLRGRPPKRNKPTNTERATGSRKRRIEAGGRRLELMLTAEENAILDQLAEHQDLPRAEVVRRMILRAAKRLPKTGGASNDKQRR